MKAEESTKVVLFLKRSEKISVFLSFAYLVAYVSNPLKGEESAGERFCFIFMLMQKFQGTIFMLTCFIISGWSPGFLQLVQLHARLLHWEKLQKQIPHHCTQWNKKTI